MRCILTTIALILTIGLAVIGTYFIREYHIKRATAALMDGNVGAGSTTPTDPALAGKLLLDRTTLQGPRGPPVLQNGRVVQRVNATAIAPPILRQIPGQIEAANTPPTDAFVVLLSQAEVNVLARYGRRIDDVLTEMEKGRGRQVTWSSRSLGVGCIESGDPLSLRLSSSGWTRLRRIASRFTNGTIEAPPRAYWPLLPLTSPLPPPEAAWWDESVTAALLPTAQLTLRCACPVRLVDPSSGNAT